MKSPENALSRRIHWTVNWAVEVLGEILVVGQRADHALALGTVLVREDSVGQCLLGLRAAVVVCERQEEELLASELARARLAAVPRHVKPIGPESFP